MIINIADRYKIQPYGGGRGYQITTRIVARGSGKVRWGEKQYTPYLKDALRNVKRRALRESSEEIVVKTATEMEEALSGIEDMLDKRNIEIVQTIEELEDGEEE